MSDNHEAHACQGEAHDHDHDHEEDETGSNLYPHIDLSNLAIYNAADSGGCKVIKPWHQRNEESSWVESDADDQLIIRIPFTGMVRLRSVLLKSGPGEMTPGRIRLFANEDSVDFSDIEEKEPGQEFHVPQGREVGEYTVKMSKFSSISSLTIFVPESQGDEATRIYYIGLRGTFSQRKREPIITVYESQANLADHEKIQGTDDGINARLGS